MHELLFLLQIPDFPLCACGILLWSKILIFTIYLLQTSGKFPVESSSVDLVVLIWKSLDFPIAQLIQEVLRVLKAGGTTLIRKFSQSAVCSDDKVITARLCSGDL
jgi:hypothetical protein